MKKLLLFCFVIAIAYLPALRCLYAGVPSAVNYQGRYREYGQPVTGYRTMRFVIYDAPAGGSVKWDSGDLNNPQVWVSSGIFNQALTPNVELRNQPLYLEMNVMPYGSSTYKQLLPRELLSSNWYSLHALSAECISASAGPVNFVIGTSTPVVINTNGIAIQPGSEILFSDGSFLVTAGSGTAMAISNSTDAVVNADANSHGTGNVLLETGGTPKLEVYNAGNVVISSGLVVNGRIQDQTGFIMPVGTILPYGGTVAPKGWLMCNGNNYNGTIYPDLYATIGTMFGNSGTAGYFNVPDLRGMFLRGAGTNNTYQTANGAYYAGGSVGTEMSDQMQGHYHQFNDLGHSHGITDNGHTHSYAFSTNDTTANTNNNNRILNSGAMSYGSYGWTSGSSKTNISINSAYTNCSIGIPTSDVTNGTPRTGAETRPASISVNYII